MAKAQTIVNIEEALEYELHLYKVEMDEFLQKGYATPPAFVEEQELTRKHTELATQFREKINRIVLAEENTSIEEKLEILKRFDGRLYERFTHFCKIHSDFSSDYSSNLLEELYTSIASQQGDQPTQIFVNALYKEFMSFNTGPGQWKAFAELIIMDKFWGRNSITLEDAKLITVPQLEQAPFSKKSMIDQAVDTSSLAYDTDMSCVQCSNTKANLQVQKVDVKQRSKCSTPKGKVSPEAEMKNLAEFVEKVLYKVVLETKKETQSVHSTIFKLDIDRYKTMFHEHDQRMELEKSMTHLRAQNESMAVELHVLKQTLNTSEANQAILQDHVKILKQEVAKEKGRVEEVEYQWGVSKAKLLDVQQEYDESKQSSKDYESLLSKMKSQLQKTKRANGIPLGVENNLDHQEPQENETANS